MRGQLYSGREHNLPLAWVGEGAAEALERPREETERSHEKPRGGRRKKDNAFRLCQNGETGEIDTEDQG